jgi:serine protease Do
MAARWRQLVRRQMYLFLLLVVAVGVLIEGAYRRYRAQARTSVETVKEAVKEAASFPPTRLVDKSSWLYLRDYVTQLVDQAAPSLALVGESGAVGVFIEPDLLLTSSEAIETLEATGVRLANGARRTAAVVGFDRELDVALLKLDSPGPSQALTVVSADERLSWLVGIGLNRKGSPVVSLELLSVAGLAGDLSGEPALQTTNLELPRGANGAAVLDFDGHLVGYIPASGHNQVLWGAPLRDVLVQLKARGRIPRAWIGLEVAEVDSAVLRHLGLASGLLVSAVPYQGPAWVSGARAGDILIEINGRAVQRVEQYREILGRLPPGTSCELNVSRDGNLLRLMTMVGEQAERRRLSAGGSWIPSLGASLRPERAVRVSESVRVSGLRVTFLAPEGPAYAAGIRPNDLLLSVDGRPARSPAQLRRQFEKLDVSVVKLLRQEKYQLVLLRKPGTHASP